MSGESWLTRRARVAAVSALVASGFHTDDGIEAEIANVSDAIAEVAREFAERALNEIMGCTEIMPHKYEAVIAEAIAAAEEE